MQASGGRWNAAREKPLDGLYFCGIFIMNLLETRLM